MRIIFGLVLIAGIGIAGFAVSVAKERFDQYRAALDEQRGAIVPVTDVFVMARPVGYGQYLTQDDVRAIRWPADHVPEGAYTSLEALFPPDIDAQRTVLRAMEPNEPVLSVKVTQPGEDAGVASRLGEGMRAIALQVDVASGVSGFLRPGDRVDVYWTGGGRDGDSVTRMIQPNVRIIAIDQITDEDRNRPTLARTITVSAAPPELARLTQAQATGSLTLALVGVRDETISGAVEVSTDSLLGEREVAAVAEAPRICTVRNRRAGEVVVTQVPCLN